MDYAISIFIMGLMVTALVAKGLLLAHDLTEEELRKQAEQKPQVKTPE